MHAFLSKVFGRKRDEKETSPTSPAPAELLDGKFEAVSPSVSPSAAKFLELDHKTNGHGGKEKDNGGLSLLRTKSRPSSPEAKHKKLDTLPHLSLNFSAPKEDSSSNAVDSYLDPESEILLTDAIIGQRRLNPMEALVLIRACSQAIISRGLETLGIMHPHWYSASPEVQRRIISQFIRSLEAKSPATASPFDSEMDFTSPHDVAAILRWGLRHLQLEGDSFGTDDGWYKAFLDAEAEAEYPPKAFSEKLSPKLPPAHLALLTATLEIFSSLAAHSEANSTSGSKLSKIFGLWLLAARRVEDKDDWHSFYTRWERTGRMLEHLFLARIRDESTDRRMPVRLLDLVRKYPYTHGLSSPTTDLQLLPAPRFTTQHHDALFVRIEIELPAERRKPKSKIHPLNLLADAFSTKVDEGEFAELWGKITGASKDGSSPSPLSNIFADETIRFLSIVPESSVKKQEAKSPSFSLLPGSPASPHKRFFSTGDENEKPVPTATTSHTKPATDPTPLTPISALAIGSDWAQFSSSGFLDSSPAIAPLVSTLFDTDLEKTVPPDTTTLSRKSSKRKAIPRKSIDMSSENATQPPSRGAPEIGEPELNAVVRASRLQIVQIDEAFVDFWSDSLLDPLTSNWPTFIICKFKSTLVPQLLYGTIEEGKEQKSLKWLVLEQVFTAKPPPPPPLPTPVDTPILRPASPAQSTSGKKRFSFWSMSRTTSSSSVGSQKGKKKEKTPKIGEMGELLEEDTVGPTKKDTITLKAPTSKPKKSLDRRASDSTAKSEDKAATDIKPAEGANTAAVVAAAATGVVATGALLAAVPEDKPVVDEHPVAQETEEAEKAVAPADVSGAPEVLEPTEAPLDEIPQADSTPKVEDVESAVEARAANTTTSVDEAPLATAEDQPTTSDVVESVKAIGNAEPEAVTETEPEVSPYDVVIETKAAEPAATPENPDHVPQPAEPVSSPVDEPVVETIAEIEPPSDTVIVSDSKVDEPQQSPVEASESDATSISVPVEEPPVEVVAETEVPSETMVAPEVKEEESARAVEVPAEVPQITEPAPALVVEPAAEVIPEVISDAVLPSETDGPKAEEPISILQVPETEVEQTFSSLQEPIDVSPPDEVVSVPVDELAAETVAEAKPADIDVLPETKGEEYAFAQAPVEVPQSAEDLSAFAEGPTLEDPVDIATEHTIVSAIPAATLASDVSVEDTAPHSTANAVTPEEVVWVDTTSPIPEPEDEHAEDLEVASPAPENVEEHTSHPAVDGLVDGSEQPALSIFGQIAPSPDTEAKFEVNPATEVNDNALLEDAAMPEDQQQPVLEHFAEAVVGLATTEPETTHVAAAIDAEPTRVANNLALEDVVVEEHPADPVEPDVPSVVDQAEGPTAGEGVEIGDVSSIKLQNPLTIYPETPASSIDAELEQKTLVSDDVEESVPMTSSEAEEIDNPKPQVSRSIDESNMEALSTTEVLESSEAITRPDATMSPGEELDAEGIDDSIHVIPDPTPVIDEAPRNDADGLMAFKFAEKPTPAFVTDSISSALDQPVSVEQITAFPDPRSINVASSVPRIEPISLPDESSSDKLVELPAVPLVEAIPLPESDETHVTISLQDSTSEHTLPAPGIELSVDDRFNETSDAIDSAPHSGSTPGPQMALSPSQFHHPSQDLLHSDLETEALNPISSEESIQRAPAMNPESTLDQGAANHREESISQLQEDAPEEPVGEQLVNAQTFDHGSTFRPLEGVAVPSGPEPGVEDTDAMVDNANVLPPIEPSVDDLVSKEELIDEEDALDDKSDSAPADDVLKEEPTVEDNAAVEVPVEEEPSTEILEEVVVHPIDEISIVTNTLPVEHGISQQNVTPEVAKPDFEGVSSQEEGAAIVMDDSIGGTIPSTDETVVESVEETTPVQNDGVTSVIADELSFEQGSKTEEEAVAKHANVEAPEEIVGEAPADEKLDEDVLSPEEATASVTDILVVEDALAEVNPETFVVAVDKMSVMEPTVEESVDLDEAVAPTLDDSLVEDMPAVQESATEMVESDEAVVKDDPVVENGSAVGDLTAVVPEDSNASVQETFVVEDLPASKEEPVMELLGPEVVDVEVAPVVTAPLVETTAAGEEPDADSAEVEAGLVKEVPVLEGVQTEEEEEEEEPVVQVLEGEAVKEEPVLEELSVVEEAPYVEEDSVVEVDEEPPAVDKEPVVEELMEPIAQQEAEPQTLATEQLEDDATPFKDEPTAEDSSIAPVEPVTEVLDDEKIHVPEEPTVTEDMVIEEAPVIEETVVEKASKAEALTVDEEPALEQVPVEPPQEPVVEERNVEPSKDNEVPVPEPGLQALAVEEPSVEVPADEAAPAPEGSSPAQAFEEPRVDISDDPITPVVEERYIEIPDNGVSHIQENSVVEALPKEGPTSEKSVAEEDDKAPVVKELVVEEGETGPGEVVEGHTAPVEKGPTVEEPSTGEEPAVDQPSSQAQEDEPALAIEGPVADEFFDMASQSDAPSFKEEPVLEEEAAAPKQSTLLAPDTSIDAVEHETAGGAPVADGPSTDMLDNATILVDEEPLLEEASVSEPQEVVDGAMGILSAEEPVNEDSTDMETNGNLPIQEEPLVDKEAGPEEAVLSALDDKGNPLIAEETTIQDVTAEASTLAEAGPLVNQTSAIEKPNPEVSEEDVGLAEVAQVDAAEEVVEDIKVDVQGDGVALAMEEPAVEDETAPEEVAIAASDEGIMASVKEEPVVEVSAVEESSAEDVAEDETLVKKTHVVDEGAVEDEEGNSTLGGALTADDGQANSVAVAKESNSFKEEPVIQEEIGVSEGANLEPQEAHTSPALDLSPPEERVVEDEVEDIPQQPIVDEDAVVSDEEIIPALSAQAENPVLVEVGFEDSKVDVKAPTSQPSSMETGHVSGETPSAEDKPFDTILASTEPETEESHAPRQAINEPVLPTEGPVNESKCASAPTMAREMTRIEGDVASVQPSTIQESIKIDDIIRDSSVGHDEEATISYEPTADDPVALSASLGGDSAPEAVSAPAISVEGITPLEAVDAHVPLAEELPQAPNSVQGAPEGDHPAAPPLEDSIQTEDQVNEGHTSVVEEVSSVDLSQAVPPTSVEPSSYSKESDPDTHDPIVEEEATAADVADPDAPAIEHSALSSDTPVHGQASVADNSVPSSEESPPLTKELAPAIEEPVPQSKLQDQDALSATQVQTASDEPIPSDKANAEELNLVSEAEQVAIPDDGVVQEPVPITEDIKAPSEDPIDEQSSPSSIVESVPLPENTSKAEPVKNAPTLATEPDPSSTVNEVEIAVEGPTPSAEEPPTTEEGILAETESVEVTNTGDVSTIHVPSEPTSEPSVASEPVSVESTLLSTGEAEADPNLEIDSKATAVEAEILNGNGHLATSVAGASNVEGSPVSEPTKVEMAPITSNGHTQTAEDPSITAGGNGIAPLETETIAATGNDHDYKVNLDMAEPPTANEVNATPATERELALPAVEQT
ncbi:hypothetical protein GALMADRAFT_138167 [Galerina marginata CBS 339.88]|uniref:Rho-GAP domain-containing protein n=1 Tax=Galerina marginata (strain CBS 339.88) TaxID=685588 RepID=A0A067TDP8_GALM3|nr:hypothetical protein GALMADRAFT_138167 [Galerina marginata CBS 339.88]